MCVTFFSLSYAGTFDVVDGVTTNARGHITAINVQTLTMPSAGANDNTTYTTSVEQSTSGSNANPIIRLTDNDGTEDDITISGAGDATVTRTSASAFTVEANFPTDDDTTYGLSLDDNLATNDSVDIKLTPSSGTADLVTIEAGTNISIVVDGDNANGFIISATDNTVDVDDTPVDNATTSAISSNWAFDNVKTAVPANALFTDTNTFRAISSTPTDGATTTSISSDWAFDNVKTAVPTGALFTDTNTVTSVGISGSETTGTVTIAGSGTVTATQSGSTITLTGSAASTQITVTEDRTNAATFYPVFASGSTGSKDLKMDDTSTTGLSYVPSTSTLKATTFSGNATTANFADLAEKYTSDAEYEVGTVLQFGGEAEVTISEYASTKVAGVVSEHPAYLMNSEIDGVAVALTGRVPCKVWGQVRKGDMMISSKYKGYAEASSFIGGAIIGKALEDKTTDGEGVIEVVVGRL